MELENSIYMNLDLGKKQNEFLNSTLWKTINNGIDIGLRYLLPDLVEDEIIDLKDNLINYGLKDGIKKSINSVIETGKEAIGIISGNFENIGQIQKVVKNGGLIDKIDNFLDKTLDKAINSGKINQTIGKIIKTGKSSVLSSVERNIESTLNSQVENSKNVEKYMNNWKKYFNDRNFSGMEKEYTKLKKELKSLVPIETTIKNARSLHILVIFSIIQEITQLKRGSNNGGKTRWKNN